MYKLMSYEGRIVCVNKTESNTITSIPFSNDNTDYANFKKEILADEAQLQDADGNLMADAKAYVSTLP